MTIKEREHLLAHINEKQQEINRRERRIDSLYKAEPFDEKRVDRLEDQQLQAYNFRNGMVFAMGCLLNRNEWLEQKVDVETPGSGMWYIKSC